jgi:hypothetical protein
LGSERRHPRILEALPGAHEAAADFGASRCLFVRDALPEDGEGGRHDFFAKNGKIREDGRMLHDMYLFEVKKPSESKGRWDDYKLLATVPGSEAFQSLEQSRCPLVKK